MLLSDKNNEPFRKSKILFDLRTIFVFSIVPPPILLPLIDFSGISRLFVFNLLVVIVPILIKLLWSNDNSPDSSLIKPGLNVKLSFNLVTVNSFISILSIVPPLIAFPLIESLVNIISPPLISNLFPLPIFIFILSIVPPLILLPIIDPSSIKNSDFLMSNTLFSPIIILLFCINPEFIIISSIVVFPMSILSIVPPFIAFPLIELSSNSKSLPIKSNWLPIPISILTLSIVPPWMVSPLIESKPKLNLPPSIIFNSLPLVILILTLFIVPPLILLPVNESSSIINVPPDKSNKLPKPI